MTVIRVIFATCHLKNKPMGDRVTKAVFVSIIVSLNKCADLNLKHVAYDPAHWFTDPVQMRQMPGSDFKKDVKFKV